MTILGLHDHAWPVWPCLSCMTLLGLHDHVYPAWSFLACITMLDLYDHVYPAWPFLACMTIFGLHDHAHSAWPCLACMTMLILHHHSWSALSCLACMLHADVFSHLCHLLNLSVPYTKQVLRKFALLIWTHLHIFQNCVMALRWGDLLLGPLYLLSYDLLKVIIVSLLFFNMKATPSRFRDLSWNMPCAR